MAALPILTLLAPIITPIVHEILGRVLPPEKMSELDKSKLEQQIRESMQNQDWKYVDTYLNDLANARTAGIADSNRGNAFTNFAGALVRPSWGLACLYFFGRAEWTHVEMTALGSQIMFWVLTYFFGTRSLEYLMGAKNGGDSPLAKWLPSLTGKK